MEQIDMSKNQYHKEPEQTSVKKDKDTKRLN